MEQSMGELQSAPGLWEGPADSLGGPGQCCDSHSGPRAPDPVLFLILSGYSSSTNHGPWRPAARAVVVSIQMRQSTPRLLSRPLLSDARE